MPCGSSTTTATGRAAGGAAAPTFSTAVSHGPRAVIGAAQGGHERRAARISRTTRSRPTTTRAARHRSGRACPNTTTAADVGDVGGCGKPGGGSDGAAAEPAALTLRQTAPDAEPLVVGQRVLEALGLDLAAVQIFLASRVEPPFSGKKASGSVSAHSARSCHDCASASRPMPSRPAMPWSRCPGPCRSPGRPSAGPEPGRRAVPAPVGRPLGRAHVVAQPRHLCHDDASPLALVPVRGPGTIPGSHSVTPRELHACRCLAVNFARCKRLATRAPESQDVRTLV